MQNYLSIAENQIRVKMRSRVRFSDETGKRYE